jgi:PAS domain S-box-containing protein
LNIMQPSDVGLCGAVVEQAPDALIFADREGTMRLWNARAEAIFGYAAGDAIGRSLDPIIPENLRAADRRGYGEKRRRRVPCRARPTRAKFYGATPRDFAAYWEHARSHVPPA